MSRWTAASEIGWLTMHPTHIRRSAWAGGPYFFVGQPTWWRGDFPAAWDVSIALEYQSSPIHWTGYANNGDYVFRMNYSPIHSDVAAIAWAPRAEVQPSQYWIDYYINVWLAFVHQGDALYACFKAGGAEHYRPLNSGEVSLDVDRGNPIRWDRDGGWRDGVDWIRHGAGGYYYFRGDQYGVTSEYDWSRITPSSAWCPSAWAPVCVEYEYASFDPWGQTFEWTIDWSYSGPEATPPGWRGTITCAPRDESYRDLVTEWPWRM